MTLYKEEKKTFLVLIIINVEKTIFFIYYIFFIFLNRSEQNKNK